jgi:hypothetical protein
MISDLISEILENVRALKRDIIELKESQEHQEYESCKLLDVVKSLNQQYQDFKKKSITSVYKERQGHGFAFEDHIISKYGLIKEKCYTSKIDAKCLDGTPVQIKYTQNLGEICMGDWHRNSLVDCDFILHLGFWEKNLNQKITVSQISLMIKADIYRNMFYIENYQEIVLNLKIINS